jgi:hypothetical protein
VERSPVPSGLGDSTSLTSSESPSPERDRSKKAAPESRFSLVLDTPPVPVTVTVTLEVRRPPTFLTWYSAPARGARPHGPTGPPAPCSTGTTSDRTGDRARPAAQRPAGPTARRAGGTSPEPPAGDAGYRKPKPLRRGLADCNCRRETRTRAARQPGTRPLGAHARQQRSARQRGRLDQRQLQDRARSLEARTRKPGISEDGGSPGGTGGTGGAGGRPRAARTGRRAPRGGRTRSTSRKRGLAPDPEAGAHGPTGGRPLVCCAARWCR